MSLAVVLFGLAFLETAAQLRKMNPAVEAELQIASNGSWHVGGFCIGMAPEGEQAARIAVTADWQGQSAMKDNGPLYLAGFDGREDRWGKASKFWDSSTCTEKMLQATSKVRLDGQGKRHAFNIDLFQVHDIRDWHFAVLACGGTESASLRIRAEAKYGALSVFEGGTFFDGNSCPVERSDWLQQAGSQVPFWVLLLVAASGGACCTLGAMFACQMRSNRSKQEKVSKSNQMEVVLGKSHTAQDDVSNPSVDVHAQAAAAKVPDETLLV